jgi:glycosyltransferase involved in cell wall biosynthesis
MQTPLVSIHMITYNHAPYIAQAIEGILMQKTNFSFELVIGEDCSTDGTREIVFDYAKSYPGIIKVITSDKNVGMYKNSFRTTQACQGKYVAYCEGDDYWQRDDKLQIQADYLETHPECGLVHSDQDRFFVGTGKKIKRFFWTTNNIPPSNFNIFRGWGSNHYHILTCTVMARKKIIDSITSDRFIYHNPQHIGGTDIPLFIEIYMKSKIHYFNESLSTYTIQDESASNTKKLEQKDLFVRSNIKVYLYLAEKYGFEEEKIYLKQKLHQANLWIAFWKNDSKLAYELKKNGWVSSINSWILYIGATNKLAFLLFHPLISIYIRLKLKTYWL